MPFPLWLQQMVIYNIFAAPLDRWMYVSLTVWMDAIHADISPFPFLIYRGSCKPRQDQDETSKDKTRQDAPNHTIPYQTKPNRDQIKPNQTKTSKKRQDKTKHQKTRHQNLPSFECQMSIAVWHVWFFYGIMEGL